METLRLLIVEGRLEDAAVLEAKLHQASKDTGPTIEAVVLTRAAELQAGIDGEPDVIVLDLGLPDMQGLDTMRHCASLAGAVPIVVYSRDKGREAALECIRLGAQDFVAKNDQSGEELLRAVLFASIRASQLQANLKPRMAALAKRLTELV